jgi:hypothetical protein
MKLDENDWKNFHTLDSVSETMSVSAELSVKMFNMLVEDPRELGSAELEYPEQVWSGPNIVARHMDEFTEAEIAEMNAAYEKEWTG